MRENQVLFEKLRSAEMQILQLQNVRERGEDGDVVGELEEKIKKGRY